jgi:hypothetical protein
MFIYAIYFYNYTARPDSPIARIKIKWWLPLVGRIESAISMHHPMLEGRSWVLPFQKTWDKRTTSEVLSASTCGFHNIFFCVFSFVCDLSWSCFAFQDPFPWWLPLVGRIERAISMHHPMLEERSWVLPFQKTWDKSTMKCLTLACVTLSNVWL